IFKVIGADSDGDGIPDSWMLQYFGHPTGLASDHSRAQDDADGDGMSNLQEYLAGTNPLDPQSSLRLRTQLINQVAGSPQLAFTAVAGVGYTLLFSDNLASGTWTKLRDFPEDPTTRTIIVNDPGAASVAARFYRLVTPIQPSSGVDSDGD